MMERMGWLLNRPPGKRFHLFWLIVLVASGVLLGCNKFQPTASKSEPAPASGKVTLSFSPQGGGWRVGQESEVLVDLNSGGQPIDAFDLQVNYDPKILQIVALEPQRVLAQYPISSTDSGKIRLVGLAAAGPGGPKAFTGSAPIAKLKILPKQASAKTILSFGNNTMVASKGRNVLEETVDGEYQISQ